MTTLAAAALDCLLQDDPLRKLALGADTARRWFAGELHCDAGGDEPIAVPVPGRPLLPRLVSPRALPRRGPGTRAGRAALLHAIAHIEFNAINLAWDAVYRYRGMPRAFYDDWVRVADDESRHFALLQGRLAEYGHSYGDFDAHDGLWLAALATADDCLERMALVPRVLEARGLDVTPAMIERLRSAGDEGSARVLETILREEIEHVAAGSRWFEWLCSARGCEPAVTFAGLLERHGRGAVRGPFNRPARLEAGFSTAEIDWLEAGAVGLPPVLRGPGGAADRPAGVGGA